MSITHAATSFRGILQGLELNLSPADLEFLDLALQAEPCLMTKHGRRRASLAKEMQTKFGLCPVKIDATLTRLVASGALHQRKTSPTLSIFPFESRKKKKPTGRCAYCKRPASKLTRDHVIPKSMGGSDEPANIVWACESCNRSKGARTPRQWAADVLRYRKPQRVPPLAMGDRIRLAVLALSAMLLAMIGGGK